MPFLAPIGVALGVGTAATATAAATGVVASTIVGALAVGSAIAGITSGITSIVSAGKASKGLDIGSLAAPASSSPVAEPAKTLPVAAQASAAEEVARRRKISLLTGGLTKLTGKGGAPILESMLQKKTLLGE